MELLSLFNDIWFNTDGARISVSVLQNFRAPFEYNINLVYILLKGQGILGTCRKLQICVDKNDV